MKYTYFVFKKKYTTQPQR